MFTQLTAVCLNFNNFTLQLMKTFKADNIQYYRWAISIQYEDIDNCNMIDDSHTLYCSFLILIIFSEVFYQERIENYMYSITFLSQQCSLNFFFRNMQCVGIVCGYNENMKLRIKIRVGMFSESDCTCVRLGNFKCIL